MFICKLLNWEQMVRVYHEHMKYDFPSMELKPLSMIQKSMERGQYFCYGYFKEDEILAYAGLVRMESRGKVLYLLDYFAVVRGNRGQAVGSSFLNTLVRMVADSDVIICESENPKKAISEEDLEVRKARIRFYLNNGFRNSGLETKLFGVDYQILTAGEKESLSIKELSWAYKTIYRSFLPPILIPFKVKVYR